MVLVCTVCIIILKKKTKKKSKVNSVEYEHLGVRYKWPYLRKFRVQDQKFKLQQKANFDRRHRMHLLPYIPDGTDVWITTDRADPIPGIVVGKAATPHTYLVDTDGGRGSSA